MTVLRRSTLRLRTTQLSTHRLTKHKVPRSRRNHKRRMTQATRRTYLLLTTLRSITSMTQTSPRQTHHRSNILHHTRSILRNRRHISSTQITKVYTRRTGTAPPTTRISTRSRRRQNTNGRKLIITHVNRHDLGHKIAHRSSTMRLLITNNKHLTHHLRSNTLISLKSKLINRNTHQHTHHRLYRSLIRHISPIYKPFILAMT